MRFEKEIDFLKKVEEADNSQNERKKWIPDEVVKMKNKFSDIPQDYLDYLMEIGSGCFRECQFKVLGELFDLSDLGLDNHFEVKEGVIFFGDNFSGDLAGFDFDKKNGLVIEFWHEDGSIYETNKTFKEYIREQMLMDESGNDLRVK